MAGRTRRGGLVVALLSAGLAWAQMGRFLSDGPPDVTLPADAAEPAEFSFARLVYGSDDGGWRRGSWRTDSPEAERHFMEGVRRLTGIHARPLERFVTLDDDEIFEYPWLYAVEVGRWSLSDDQAGKLREYLLRGGFLVVDDFHGSREWAVFLEGLAKVFPDRAVVDVPLDDPVFHVFYNVDDRVQVPGVHWVRSGRTFERDGVEPHWRGVYDDDGRLMVMINFNMDLGDAWEWADYPDYPERWTALAYRFGINYVVYAMTH